MEDQAVSERSNPKQSLSTPSDAKIPLWISIAVLLGALLMAAGAVIALVRPAMLISPEAEITEGIRIYAGYLVSRNLAIAILLFTLLALRARRALGHLMVLVGFIQLFDFFVDCSESRWAVAPGVLIFGILYVIAAARLAGHAFWKSAAWRN
jgi:hypothetical protein